MKVAGLLLLAAACTAVGLAESRKLGERAAYLEGFLRFLTQAEAEIRYGMMPVREVVFSCRSQMELLDFCASKLAAGVPFPSAWRQSAERFGGEDTQFLLDFGKGLGSTDLEGQLAHLQLYRKLAESRLKEARANRDQKGKLYRQLGVYGGIALALVLW